jgi:uncharacterized protein YlzI (FlbEa/FlbD family)
MSRNVLRYGGLTIVVDHIESVFEVETTNDYYLRITTISGKEYVVRKSLHDVMALITGDGLQ